MVATPLLLAAAGAATLGGWWWAWRRPGLSPTGRGEVLAQRLGCFACHGPEGQGGIANPGSAGGSVPSWEGPIVDGYARDEQEIREWILHGAPRSGGALPASPLIPMPAYEGRLSGGELDDLVAYFHSVSGGAARLPDAAYEGRKVALRFGCFGCHGPSGLGGCNNPGSFKGYIPAWDGEEFAELVQDEKELREWILDGRPQRLWDNVLARHFLESQIIQMPAYRPHLSETEVDQLVAYIEWLRRGKG